MANINDVPQDETFSKYTIIDRYPYANYLTKFLNSKADNGYVINLNAEWGAGKTTFLRCWYNELRSLHPVVYFDAWKSDFTHNAMLAITESFHTQLMSPLKEDSEWLEKFRDKSTRLFKTALPNLLVGYLKHKTGQDSEDSLLGDITNDLGIDIEDDEMGDALKETMKAMLSQKRKVDGIQTFKNKLEDLAECYLQANTNTQVPIYVLIDELDRCRPTYAIEVIECVKHFFNTKNFVFVLATDTEQLQHSIKAVYGNGFNSNSYLSRFFDKTAVLPSPTVKQFLKSRLTEIIGHFPSGDLEIDALIENIFTWHGITSLRDIQKILNDVEVAKSMGGSFKILCLIIISILKHRFPIHYRIYAERHRNPYVSPSVSASANLSPESYILQVQFVPNFPLSRHKEAPMSAVIYHLMTSMTNQENNKTYADLKDDNSNNHNLPALLCHAISKEFLTNDPDPLYRPLTDYVSAIDFAGHISVETK